MLTQYFVPVLLISLKCATANLSLDDLSSAVENDPEDGRLQFCELAQKYGYPCIRYNVTTKDGYILGLFRIPSNSKKVVFCMHGFVDSSDTWIIRGFNSIAALLANNTFDIFFGNMRGNMHSREHVFLNPDRLDYWNFSFHEIAIYDIPATIDFILETTGEKQLQVVAHSEGALLFFALGSLLPGIAYCSKIKNVVCLAPIAYLHHAQQPLFPFLSLAGGPFLSGALGYTAQGEFLGNSSALVSLVRTACKQGLVGYTACGVGVSSLLFGPDPQQFEPAFERVAWSHYPCGTSMKNAVHLIQIAEAKRCQQYDYGVIENFKKYNSPQPPAYELGKVCFNVSLYSGLNDRLADVTDFNLLKEQLPPRNVLQNYVMPPEQWNHIDFIWGKEMPKYLFKPLLDTLNNNI